MLCIEWDVIVMWCLKSGSCIFDEVVKMIDVGDFIKSFFYWFSISEMMGIDDNVCEVLE